MALASDKSSSEKKDGGGSLQKFLALLATKGFDDVGYHLDQWVNEGGENPLHVCAQEGEVEMVASLLEMNMDVNKRDRYEEYDCDGVYGKTPLFWAARRGHVAVVSLLLQHEADKEDALYEACRYGHTDVVRVLLQAGADPLQEGWNGTPARICCVDEWDDGEEKIETDMKKRKADILAVLLQGGANVNEFDDEGLSLLHDAACTDAAECIAVLIKEGRLDPNVQSIAVNESDVACSPLHIACAFQSTNAVKELVRLGANLDILDAEGRTPLVYASACGKDGCVSAMLALGANVADKDKWGFGPLHYAASAGHVKCAYLLIEGGAPVDALSDDAYSPIMLCMKPDLLPAGPHPFSEGSKEGRARVARLLIEMGAELSAKVLMYAVEGGMNDVLAESLTQLRNITKSLSANSITIGDTLLSQSEEVVFVKLVNRVNGELNEHQYKLNTGLIECLAPGRGGEHGQSATFLAPSSAGSAASSCALSNLLNPRSRGFNGGDDDGGSSSGGCSKEVVLSYDGSDFTVEGFGVVAAYLTTGRVDHLLVNKTLAGISEAEVGETAGTQDEDKSDGGGGGGGGSGREQRKRPRGGGTGEESASSKKIRLFHGELAGKALEAADFFGLEGLTEELKRLMDAYGFEYKDTSA